MDSRKFYSASSYLEHSSVAREFLWNNINYFDADWWMNLLSKYKRESAKISNQIIMNFPAGLILKHW